LIASISQNGQSMKIFNLKSDNSSKNEFKEVDAIFKYSKYKSVFGIENDPNEKIDKCVLLRTKNNVSVSHLKSSPNFSLSNGTSISYVENNILIEKKILTRAE